jgi:hypothetical protein
MPRRPRRLADRSTTPVTAARVDAIRHMHEPCFWVVVNVIECAALVLGEVSPAVQAQAIRLLEPTPEEMGGD